MSSHIKKMEEVKINSQSFIMKGKKTKDGVYVGVERGKETEPTLITAKQKKRERKEDGEGGSKNLVPCSTQFSQVYRLRSSEPRQSQQVRRF